MDVKVVMNMIRVSCHGGEPRPTVPKGPAGPGSVVVVCMRHVVEAATSGREAGIAVMGSVVVGVRPPWTCGWA